MADMNHLAMSDEDFLRELPPETVEAPVVETQEQNAEQTNTEQTQETEQQEAVVETPEPKPDDAGTKDPVVDDAGKAPEGVDPAQTEEKPGEKVADPAGSASAGDATTEKTKEPEADAAPNYESMYQQIMKPFMANGKEIKLDKPEEAIQLMQMGANYTRKMQELAPFRKLTTMIKNNGIDEDKLSFLIDLDKKDPEAIKKLIKDSGLDPLDIDTNTEPAYREGSHKVSDQEQAFTSQLDELGSNQDGRETLQEIEKSWDQTSKDMLYQHPEVMSVIHAQRKSGIYATIVAEVDRQKLLGQLKPDVPFLEAYKTAGDVLHAANAFGTVQQEQTATPVREPVIVRTAAPKADVEASEKAAAAGATRAAPRKASEAVNFLSMSDEEFAKHEGFAGRV